MMNMVLGKKDLNSDDFYKFFEGYESDKYVDEEFNKLYNKPFDSAVLAVQREILEIKEEMVSDNIFEREIILSKISNGYYRPYIKNVFKLLAKKYDLIKAKEDIYTFVIPIEIDYNNNEIMDIDWFFKYLNTQFSEFLIKSKKIYLTDNLFLIPLVRKISRGKHKGIDHHYIIIDNSLKVIYIYKVNNLRYLEDKSNLYKFLNNMYSKVRLKLFIKDLTIKAPIMASNNLDIMKLVFKGKINNFYRDGKLIKQYK